MRFISRATERTLIACTAMTCSLLSQAQLFVQQAEIYPAGSDNADYFGWVLDVDGDRSAVGAPKSDVSVLQDAGRVYLFEWQSGTGGWVADGMVTDVMAVAGAEFGAQLALAGDRLAVSNKAGCSGGAWECGVQTFIRTGPGTWVYDGALVVPAEVNGGEFGRCIAMNGNWAAVGGGLVNGRESVVMYDLALGLQAQAVISEDPLLAGTSEGYGRALALDDDVLWIAAPGDDELGIDAGAAYVHDLNGSDPGQWGLVRKILASNGGPGDGFGGSIAVDDGLAVVSALGRSWADSASGAAYVFDVNEGFAGNWGEVAEIGPTVPLGNMQFGWSVDIANGLVIVGAPRDDAGLGTIAQDGAVFVYDGSASPDWTQTQRIAASENLERFGNAVHFTAGGFAAGAPWNNASSDNKGMVRVFRSSGIGYDEVDTGPWLVLAPDPAQDRCTLRLPSGLAAPGFVELLDPYGRILRRTGIRSDAMDLERMGMPAGLCLVRVLDAQGVVKALGKLVWE